MKKHLNRIEYEYIFDTFVREKPPLNFLCKNSFVDVDSCSYKIIDGYIFFKAEGVKVKDEVKIFFNHKQRPLYFFSCVEKKEGILVCKLSDKFYKYDEEVNDCTNIYFWNSNGFKFQAGISKDFPLCFPYPPVIDEEDIEYFLKFSFKITSLSTLDIKKIPKAFFDRLYTVVVKKRIPEFEPCLLYIDADLILIFCSEDIIKPISAQISTQAEIGFGHRIVNFLSVYSFFYPIPNSGFAGKKNGILCLLIKDMQEEDKRFLHEKIHSTKYGYPKN